MTQTNLAGKRFGRLVVTEFSHIGKNRNRYWECLCDCGNITKVATATLQRGHTSSCGCYGQNLRRIHDLNEFFFENIDTEEKAYWLGFIFADGNISKNNKCFQIVLHKDDKEHLFKMKKSFGATQPVFDVRGKYFGVSIKNKAFCRHLINLGVTPRKSKTAIPPSLPVSLERHFWRGVIDGDGSINYSKNKDRFAIGIVGSKGIVFGFKEFINSFGIGRKINPKESKISQNIYAFAVEGKRQIAALAEILYDNSNIYLDRKFNKSLEAIHWSQA